MYTMNNCLNGDTQMYTMDNCLSGDTQTSACATALMDVSLSKEQLEKIVEKAKQWALLHGVQMRPRKDPSSRSQVEYGPMTLFPSAMPRVLVAEARDLQKHFNILMHKVGHDHEFLKSALQNVIEVDSFTKMLWDIYTTVREHKLGQPISVGLFRNDYMLDIKDSCCDIGGLPASVHIKQIEFNTVAASFAGLSSAIWNVHRYTMSMAGVQYNKEQIPENNPASGLASGLVKGWELYDNPCAVILFIVLENERNVMDQAWLEKGIYEQTDGRARVLHATLAAMATRGSLTEDYKLLIDDVEVAVVYFRAGYSPDDYPSLQEKDVRLTIEKSKALKCPSVHCQLAGCKKIQQVLAEPGVVEKYIKDRHMCERLRNTFAGQYSLDKGPAGDRNIAMALKSPERFVLKPQREGGGNNMYDEDIRRHLEKIRDSEERNAYILMERIFPWPQKNHLLSEGHDWTLREVISELGIYGVYIGSESEEICNEEVGYLLRTKSKDDNEGGVSVGYSVIDSPFFLELCC